MLVEERDVELPFTAGRNGNIVPFIDSISPVVPSTWDLEVPITSETARPGRPAAPPTAASAPSDGCGGGGSDGARSNSGLGANHTPRTGDEDPAASSKTSSVGSPSFELGVEEATAYHRHSAARYHSPQTLGAGSSSSVGAGSGTKPEQLLPSTLPDCSTTSTCCSPHPRLHSYFFHDFEGPSFAEPIVELRSIWEWLYFPFGCTIPLARPTSLSPLRTVEEESLVYVPLLSGFRLGFLEHTGGYQYLKELRRAAATRASPAATGDISDPDASDQHRNQTARSHTGSNVVTPRREEDDNIPHAELTTSDGGISVRSTTDAAPFRKGGDGEEDETTLNATSTSAGVENGDGDQEDIHSGDADDESVTVLRWSASERPDNRNTISTQIEALMEADPRYTLLTSANTSELDHQSWIAILWQPVFCGGHTAKEGTGSFLAFYLLRPPYQLFQPYVTRSESARRNASCTSSLFRADRSAIGFDLWQYQRDYRAGRVWCSSGHLQPQHHQTMMMMMRGEEEEDMEQDPVSARRYQQNSSNHHKLSTTSGGSSARADLHQPPRRATRIPLVGLIPNRCRTDVWYPSLRPWQAPRGAASAGGGGGGAGGGASSRHSSAQSMMPYGSSRASMPSSQQMMMMGGGGYLFRAPLFLTVSALQLMVWTTYTEDTRRQQGIRKTVKQAKSNVPPSSGSQLESPQKSPATQASQQPPESGATNAALLTYPYFSRGLSLLLLSASKYKHIREQSHLDAPYGAPSNYLPAAAITPDHRPHPTEPESITVAGGTHSSLLKDSEAKIISGLLDFFQWAQYDNALMEFAERYCQ